MGILSDITTSAQQGKKLVAQLIDPDKISGHEQLFEIARQGEECGLDYFFFGGSLITRPSQFQIISALKKMCSVPVVLFPSSPLQISGDADAILFISLISGRNPEYLIGHHVTAAPYLKALDIEVIPTGYMLIQTGIMTTAQYISGTSAIPANKPEIAAATALAGEMLGQKLIYIDAGSGAESAISAAMVSEVKSVCSIPVIVGGGIQREKDAAILHDAGADMVVVGTAAENNPHFIASLCNGRSK